MCFPKNPMLDIAFKNLNKNLLSLRCKLNQRIVEITVAVDKDPSLADTALTTENKTAVNVVKAITDYITEISMVLEECAEKKYGVVEKHWKQHHDEKERIEFVSGKLISTTHHPFITMVDLFDCFAQIAGFFVPYINLPTKTRPAYEDTGKDTCGCRHVSVEGVDVIVETDGAGYEYIPLTINPYDQDWKSPIYLSEGVRTKYVFNGRCCDAIKAVEEGYADATVSLRNRRDMSLIYPIIYLDPEIGRQKRLKYIKSIRETPSIRGWTLEFAEKSPMGGYVSKPLIMSGQFAHLFPATKFFVQDRKLAEHAKNTIIKLAELTAEKFFANAPKTVDGMYDALSMFLAENNLQNEGYANLYIPLVLGMISDSFDNYSLSAWKEKYSLEVVQCISEDWHS